MSLTSHVSGSLVLLPEGFVEPGEVPTAKADTPVILRLVITDDFSVDLNVISDVP